MCSHGTIMVIKKVNTTSNCSILFVINLTRQSIKTNWDCIFRYLISWNNSKFSRNQNSNTISLKEAYSLQKVKNIYIIKIRMHYVSYRAILYIGDISLRLPETRWKPTLQPTLEANHSKTELVFHIFNFHISYVKIFLNLIF